MQQRLPAAKVVPCKYHVSPRAISWVYLCVNYVSFCEQSRDQIMDVGRKALEAGLVPHEAMNVYQKQPPLARIFGGSTGN